MLNNIFTIYSDSVFEILTELIWLTAIFLLSITLIEHFSNKGITKFIKKNKPLSYIGCAILGFIPGCGGTIFATALYAEGAMTMGALTVTYLITIGDSAWVLISSGEVGLWLEISFYLIIISFITGPIVDLIFKNKHFSKQQQIDFHSKHMIVSKTPVYGLHNYTLHGNNFNYTELSTFEADKKEKAAKIVSIKIPIAFWVLMVSLLTLVLIGFITGGESNSYKAIVILIGTILIIFKLMITHIERKYDLDHYYSDLDHHIHDAVDRNHKEAKKAKALHSIADVCDDVLSIFVWIFIGTFSYGIVYSASQATDSTAISDFVKSLDFAWPLLATGLGMLPGNEIPIFLLIFFLESDGLVVPLAAIVAISVMHEGHGGYQLLRNDTKTYFKIKLVKLPIALIASYAVLLLA